MKQLGAITDPVYLKPAAFSATDAFLLLFIKDERDLAFAYLTLKITLTLVPMGVLLYIPFINGWVWWLTPVLYAYFNNFVYKGPFGLMLHCTSHRVFSKREYNFMNHYLPWFIVPFFGHSPETYYTHHYSAPQSLDRYWVFLS